MIKYETLRDLTKMAGLLESEDERIRLMAVRECSRMLKLCGISWIDLIVGKYERDRWVDEKYTHHMEVETAKEWAAYENHNCHDFLESLAEFYDEWGDLTDAQWDAFYNTVKSYRIRIPKP